MNIQQEPVYAYGYSIRSNELVFGELSQLGTFDSFDSLVGMPKSIPVYQITYKTNDDELVSEEISLSSLSIFSGFTDKNNKKIFTGDVVYLLGANYKCHYSTDSTKQYHHKLTDHISIPKFVFYLKNTFNNSDIDFLKVKEHLEVVTTEKHKLVEIFERDKKINLILNFKN